MMTQIRISPPLGRVLLMPHDERYYVCAECLSANSSRVQSAVAERSLPLRREHATGHEVRCDRCGAVIFAGR